MKLLTALLCAAALLTIAVSSAGPAHALNGCNPQVSKC